MAGLNRQPSMSPEKVLKPWFWVLGGPAMHGCFITGAIVCLQAALLALQGPDAGQHKANLVFSYAA